MSEQSDEELDELADMHAALEAGGSSAPPSASGDARPHRFALLRDLWAVAAR
jgi:hypothetical protein